MHTDSGAKRQTAAAIVHRLRAAGHEACFVGGCVRDLVLGRTPGDYDIVTSAHPGEVQRLFPVTIPVGISFGVVLVIEDGRNHEVATYRTEDGYADGRRPSRVSFSSAEEDVKRRDFTINALLMDPDTGHIIDYVGGLDDIRRRIIRTVGSSERRFAEDHLRMLRAVRFAANLGFSIDQEAFNAIRENAPSILKVSPERIRDELTKLLKRSGARSGLMLLRETGLLKIILPEVEALKGIEQPPAFHPEGDVWEHTLAMLGALHEENAGDEVDGRLAWAVVLHDVGKAVTRFEDERGVHFYGHVEKGGRIAEAVARRLKFPGADVETILALVQHHMRFMHVRDMKSSTLKRFLRLPDFGLHLDLHRLDCLGSHGLLDNYEFCREALVRWSEEELRPPKLLSGHDLTAMGFSAGPLFKKILRSVEDAQMDGHISSPADARRWVLDHWGSDREDPDA